MRTQDVGYGFRVVSGERHNIMKLLFLTVKTSQTQISRDELRTLSVICTRKGYRFNSAKRKGHDDLDMVQVFEGAEAKQVRC